MSTSILVPNEAQTQLLFESPMSTGEKKRKLSLAVESLSASLDKFERKRVMARCLTTIYQELLFRGDHGSRTWGEFLASEEEMAAFGYDPLDTDRATDEMNWHFLCQAIDEWNDSNSHRPPLPYPKGRTFMDGWQRLFERSFTSGASSYHRYSDNPAAAALKAWYSACIKQPSGRAPTSREAAQIGRAARDSGLARPALTAVVPSNLERATAAQSARREAAATAAAAAPRTLSSQDRLQAEADSAEREQRQREQRQQELEDRQAGIDPRSLQVEKGDDDLDAIDQCQKYRALLNQAQSASQALLVFLKSKVNHYGSDYLDFLRQVDAGIWSVDNDTAVVKQSITYLLQVEDLCCGHYAPGEFDIDIHPEPSR